MLILSYLFLSFKEIAPPSPVVMVFNGWNEKIEISSITEDLSGKIIVCGSYIDYEIYSKAKEVQVSGIVCGGVDYNTISKILGYSLGVAITGTENTTTLILTEGFGEVNMAKRTFDLLIVLTPQQLVLKNVMGTILQIFL